MLGTISKVLFANKLMKMMDANHDGVITQQDFMMMGGRFGGIGRAAGALLFNAMDVNHNGVLDPMEVLYGVGAFQYGATGSSYDPYNYYYNNPYYSNYNYGLSYY